METSERYFKTIEHLMVENSRLTKDLQDAINGKLPSRIVSQEEAEHCFELIANHFGPVARGNLLGEIRLLCEQLQNTTAEYANVATKIKSFEKEQEAITLAIK